MRRSIWYVIMIALGISVVFSASLFYINAKAMTLGAGDITLHWDHYGEGWPEFALLGLALVIMVYALVSFYEEGAA